MPEDVVRNVLEYLPPETLSTIRGASPEWRDMVDSYVLKLVETGELQDPEGRDLRYLEYRPEPWEILESWGNNDFARNRAPLSEEEVAARAESFDPILTPDVTYEEDPVAFNEEFQRMLAGYAELLEQGGTGAEELDAALYSYFQMLLRGGRIVDAATDNPLPTGTSSSQVMQLLRNGQARWIAPEEAAARAESFDPILTPDVTYEEDPVAFNEEFQRTLAGYAELLEQGGTGAEGLDAALRSYFQMLLREGRIVDAATDNPLPASTSSSQVMQLLRNGQARWIAPYT